LTAELMFRPADELAAMIRDGEISSRELVTTSLERIESLDGELNAFVDVDADGALAAADAISTGDQRPFAGVPIAIKNNRAVKGWRLTYGCPLMKDFIAPYDHNVVRRIREAGFIIVGTTTLPEYGILPVTEAQLFGPTRGTSSARRADRPVARPRRWQPGWCRSPMATTAAGLSESPPPAADSSG
jgi:amidase